MPHDPAGREEGRHWGRGEIKLVKGAMQQLDGTHGWALGILSPDKTPWHSKSRQVQTRPHAYSYFSISPPPHIPKAIVPVGMYFFVFNFSGSVICILQKVYKYMFGWMSFGKCMPICNLHPYWDI